jgi:RimJ/RimL family protein N-acetyltransferase
MEHPTEHEWYLGWEIVLPEERIAIGGIGLAGPPDADGTVIAGYHCDQRQRGKGFVSEAMKAVCDWAFSDLRVKKIVATILGWNAASVKVAERCGFTANGKRMEQGMEVLVYELNRNS